MLYIRMGAVMLAQLYVARVVLNILGAADYGIYNVVGGIVVMFSFLSRTLASASQRYFAFELGRKDFDRLNKVFNINLLLFVIIIGSIIFLAETIGLWFMHAELIIPRERLFAADWVYQFSIFSFSITLLAIPYQAVIIAREQMNIYAYIGIFESLLNVVFVLLLQLFNWSVDVLIVYGAMMFLVHLITNGCYILISRRRYKETHYKYYWDSILVREIISYSGWNLFGAVAGILRSQGINILINMFFNPAINAARGLAYQVNNALNQFSNNFYTAVRPQVTKLYAQNDRKATMALVFSSAKLTYFLLLFLAVPVITFVHEILDLWLVDIPEKTDLFLVLVIIVALIDSISHPLMTLAQATGEIKLYQLVVGGLLVMNLPLSWIVLKMGYEAEYTMYVAIGVAIISLFARLIILKRLVSFPIRFFCISVLFPSFLITLFGFLGTYLTCYFLIKENSNIYMLCLAIVCSICLTLFLIVGMGLTRKERAIVLSMITTKFKRKCYMKKLKR